MEKFGRAGLAVGGLLLGFKVWAAPPAALTNHLTAASVAPYVCKAVVHDPSTIVRCNGEYWVFYTGRGVPSLHSKDLVNWSSGPSVFMAAPAWVAGAVPAGVDMVFWAPDVACLGGRYLLYYSASSFGSRASGIGLATAPTLDPADPACRWTDCGPVVVSGTNDAFNAIDPAIFHDDDGSLWLLFGSFWDGVKMVQLDPATGKRLSPGSPVYSLAKNDSIEAPCLCKHAGFYYLFVNWGWCCRGTHSTYRICVGRSRRVAGPYFDLDGKDMRQGGGTIFLDTVRPFVGPGHAGIIEAGGKFWLSCHYEGVEPAGDAAAKPFSGPRLAVMPMRWRADGWPEAGPGPE